MPGITTSYNHHQATSMQQPLPLKRLGRRAFIRGSVLVLATTSCYKHSLMAADGQPVLKIGLITDLHYADKPPAGSRHYRETLGKFAEAAERFTIEKPEFVVELGDLIDAADSVETEQRYLKTINDQFSVVCKDRHYVLGNHCVDTLKKEEFLGTVGQPKSYYSFDRGAFHLIVLDSCFRSDGKPYERKNFEWTDANVPSAELEWLQADLAETTKPVIVFAHQRLDVENHHGVRNAPAVRAVLESSGKISAVFQGHSHQNDWQEIGGIHYCTLVAMIEGSGAENNGYSLLSVSADGTMQLNGFRKQKDYQWS